MKICFGNCGEIVSPLDFVIVAQTHAYSFPRLMIFYFELVELSMNLENIEELGRPEFILRPPPWLLYSFLAQIFLQWVGLEKDYRNQNREMNIVKNVDKVDKEDKLVENWTRRRWISIDSVKSWNYFRNYGHKIGSIGCIDSDKSNPVYLVGSYLKNQVEIIQIKWGQCEVWIHIRIERIIVVEFYFTNNYKQKKKRQTTNKKNKIKTKPILGLT